jgi:hypothetical protein
MSPLGDRVIRDFLKRTIGKLCLAANFVDMKECDAPESKSTIARTELTRNSPSTTSDTSIAS